MPSMALRYLRSTPRCGTCTHNRQFRSTRPRHSESGLVVGGYGRSRARVRRSRVATRRSPRGWSCTTFEQRYRNGWPRSPMRGAAGARGRGDGRRRRTTRCRTTRRSRSSFSVLGVVSSFLFIVAKHSRCRVWFVATDRQKSICTSCIGRLVLWSRPRPMSRLCTLGNNKRQTYQGVGVPCFYLTYGYDPTAGPTRRF
jgi:hypothetical protein